MEVPIQVAVQIRACLPSEPCCVETIPNYIDGNVTNNNNDSMPMGLVRISRPQSQANSDVINGNSAENDAKPTTFPIQYALPYGCKREFLYRKCIQPMIFNFLDGYDISIVTYGQCGMGKTYTMYAKFDDGSEFNEEYQTGGEKEKMKADPGVVIRAINDMFMHLLKRPVGCRFAIKVGWLDLCGDDIYDLLDGVEHARDGVVQCYSIDDVFNCLRNGSAKRRRNAHNLFTIAIEQQWITADGLIQHTLSTANFCDLAGTERQPTATVNEFMVDEHSGESVPKDNSLQALERIVRRLCTASSSTINQLDNEQNNLLNQYEHTMLTKFLKNSFGGRAQTLMVFCVSPLEQDAIETIQNLQFAYRAQFVRNKVVMNTFADNNMPMWNFLDVCDTPDINLLSKAIHFNGAPMNDKTAIIGNRHRKIVDGRNCNSGGGGQNLKFANSQWLKLVANAEGLFNKLLANNKILNEQDRECIEEWMYSKRECDDCFGTVGFIPTTTPSPPSIQHTLGPIQETKEPTENGNSDGGDVDDNDHNIIGDVAIAMQKVIDSDGQFNVLNETDLDDESDMDQFEYLPERISELMHSFSCNMNEIIDQDYADFVRTYPNGVMQSASDDDADKSHQQQKLQPSKPPSSPSTPTDAIAAAVATSAVSLPYVKARRSNSVDLPNEAYPIAAGRRRSIHAAAADVASAADGDSSSSAIPNTVELARLNRLADECIQNSQNSQTTSSSTNTVCREINDFLDNSDELHPLRMANRNRAEFICRLQNDIEVKKKQIQELQQTIKERTQLMKQCQPGKQSLKQREEHLLQQKEKWEKTLAKSREKKKIEKSQMELMQIKKDLNEVHKMKEASRDNDTTVRECEQHIEKCKKQIVALKKEIKNQKKTVEKLHTDLAKTAKGEKKSTIHANAPYIDTHITQLDCVLKEKRMYLQQQTGGESPYVDSLRHEIRNLRSQRERLTEQQWAWQQKLNGSDRLIDRQFLQYDVAKEVIDYAIEYKNQLISNKKTILVESPDLMNQLTRLTEKEMRIVLYKCLQKIVDLRKSTRYVENELLRLDKELDKAQSRERTITHQFQQFRLKSNGYVLSLENQYDKLLRIYLQGSGSGGSGGRGGGMQTSRNEAPPLLMSPSHILHSKHHQQYRHQQQQQQHQRATLNEIEYNVHDNENEQNDNDHRKLAQPQQRHPYRVANTSAAIIAAPPAIESVTPTTATAFDSFQKQKPQKLNNFLKLLRHSPLMLTNHSQSAAHAESGSKVTVDKNTKKIVIQQNKTH